MGIMVKALTIFLRSANSTFAPSGWFMHAWSHIDRGGSVQSNHPRPMLNNTTHFAISAMKWFKKVRGGSMRLNYTELVRNHPAHLASLLNV